MEDKMKEEKKKIKKWAKGAVERYGINSADTFFFAYQALSDEVEVYFELQPCARDEYLLQRLRAISDGIGELKNGKGQMGLYTNTDYIYRNTNSRSPRDIQKIANAVEKGDWAWIVERIPSYRQSAMADTEREKNKHEIFFDDVVAADGTTTLALDVAEAVAYKNGYYNNGNSQLLNRIDAEKACKTKKAISLFERYQICEDDAIAYLVMTAETLNRDIEEIINDSRFETFLSAVTITKGEKYVV
jgi:hypothetical protein